MGVRHSYTTSGRQGVPRDEGAHTYMVTHACTYMVIHAHTYMITHSCSMLTQKLTHRFTCVTHLCSHMFTHMLVLSARIYGSIYMFMHAHTVISAQ